MAAAPTERLLDLADSDGAAPAQDESRAFDRNRAWRPRGSDEPSQQGLRFVDRLVRFATQPLGTRAGREQIGEGQMAVKQRVPGFAEQGGNRPRRQTHQDRLGRFDLPEDARAATQTGDA